MTHNNNPVIDLAKRSETMERRSWLSRHCRGDRTAFPKLMQWLRQPVYTYLIRCGISTDSRDDVFQEIFLKIHAAAASYQSDKPLKPWVFTIAANTVRNHFRTEKNRRVVPLQHQLETCPDPAPGAERHAAASEAANWLEQAIYHLPLAQREVLVLTTIQGLQLKQVADILNTPLNTIKTHLRRARLALLKARAAHEQEEDRS